MGGFEWRWRQDRGDGDTLHESGIFIIASTLEVMAFKALLSQWSLVSQYLSITPSLPSTCEPPSQVEPSNCGITTYLESSGSITMDSFAKLTDLHEIGGFKLSLMPRWHTFLQYLLPTTSIYMGVPNIYWINVYSHR